MKGTALLRLSIGEGLTLKVHPEVDKGVSTLYQPNANNSNFKEKKEGLFSPSSIFAGYL